jgi:hypothetical protein
MAAGWRMLILPYLLDWSTDWHEFAGTVEPTYNVARDGCGVGHGLKWSQPVDPEYNYYNLETVMAFRRTCAVPAGTVTFTAVPWYDPELHQQQKEQR